MQSTFDEINPPRGKGRKYGKGVMMMGKGKSGGMMKGYDMGGMMMSMGRGKGSMRKRVHYGKGIMYHENVLFRNDDDDNDNSSENNLLTLIRGPSL